MTHLYIVVVQDDGEEFQYEFGNLKHAKELFDNEKSAQLIEYIDGKHHLVEAKYDMQEKKPDAIETAKTELAKAHDHNKLTNPYANDLLVDRHKLLPLTNDQILDILKSMYPFFKLYSLPSLDWRTTATYIAKARGKHGDVIISWI